MRETDYPALYQATDSASLAGQRVYLKLLGADLGLLVVGALLSSIDSENADVVFCLRVGGALALFLSVGASIVIKVRADEERWYGGRAAAESVKTISWRYMMRAAPFNQPEAEADRIFGNSLEEILKQKGQLSLGAVPSVGSAPQISKPMREVRAKNLDDRKELYGRERIEDQRDWYARKATLNGRRASQFFALLIGSQGLALVAAVAMILRPTSPLDYAAVFSAVAAAVISWIQVKKYEELAQSYDVAAQELGIVAEQLRHLTNEEAFSQFVGEAESAVSREHTLWVARRSRGRG